MPNLKPTPSKLEEYLRNSTASILRDAKANIWEELPNLGERRFLERHLGKVERLMPKVSEKLTEFSYRMLNTRQQRFTEVIFYVPTEGPLTPFTTIGTHFRLRGEVGTERNTNLYIYYREPHATTAQNLVESLRVDLDLIHQYLDLGNSILDAMLTETRVQLVQEINLTRAVIGDLPQIAEGLAELGFRSRLLDDDSR